MLSVCRRSMVRDTPASRDARRSGGKTQQQVEGARAAKFTGEYAFMRYAEVLLAAAKRRHSGRHVAFAAAVPPQTQRPDKAVPNRTSAGGMVMLAPPRRKMPSPSNVLSILPPNHPFLPARRPRQ